MDPNMVTDAVKARVSCRELMEANGIRVNRHGFCVCPFHGDKDASLKIYGSGRGWVCYGCHKGGDVINLAKLLYNVGFKDAIARLNDQFKLGLSLDEEPPKKEMLAWLARKQRKNAEQRKAQKQAEADETEYWWWFERWQFLDELCAELEPKPGEEWSPAFCGYVKLRAETYNILQDLEMRRTSVDG